MKRPEQSSASCPGGESARGGTASPVSEGDGRLRGPAGGSGFDPALLVMTETSSLMVADHVEGRWSSRSQYTACRRPHKAGHKCRDRLLAMSAGRGAGGPSLPSVFMRAAEPQFGETLLPFDPRQSRSRRMYQGRRRAASARSVTSIPRAREGDYGPRRFITRRTHKPVRTRRPLLLVPRGHVPRR